MQKQKACRDGEGKLMENEIKSFRMLKDTNKQTLRFCSVGIFKTGYWNLNKETRYLDHDNICMNKENFFVKFTLSTIDYVKLSNMYIIVSVQ